MSLSEDGTVAHRFGVLDYPRREVSFSSGTVAPLPNEEFQAVRRWYEDHGHDDGWLYPSTLHWERTGQGPGGGSESLRWPASEPRPSSWRPVPTHMLTWTASDPDRQLAGLAIRALGWAHGSRVQFEDWRIDGRIRWKPSPSFHLTDSRTRRFLDRVVATGSTAPNLLVGILALLELHTRVPMYTWDWERHHWQYTAVDACWRVLVAQQRVPDRRPSGGRWPHTERIRVMCDQLGIPYLAAATKRIVEQRNDLAHEAIWCEGLPGYGGEQAAHYDYFRLRKLTDRLLLHIFDIDCELRTRSWDVGGLVCETMGWPE